MRHHLLKIDTETDDVIERILLETYAAQLQIREDDAEQLAEEDGEFAEECEFDSARYDNAFLLLLQNKGITKLREMVIDFNRKTDTRTMRIMIKDLMEDLDDPFTKDFSYDQLSDYTNHVFSELVMLCRKALFEKLFTFAVVEQLYEDGYDIYSRDKAEDTLSMEEPQDCGDLLMMVAASGRHGASLLLRDHFFAGTSSDDFSEQTTTGAMIMLSHKMALYIHQAAPYILEPEDEDTKAASPTDVETISATEDAVLEQSSQAITTSVEAEANHVAAYPPPATETPEPALIEVGAPIEVHTPFTENGGLDAISAQLLREEVETLTAANERLKEELRHANERTKEVTKASRQQKYLNTILSQQLSESSGNKSRSTQNGNGAVDEPETQTDPLAEFIRQTAALRFTPAEALEALQLLLPANVIVLPSAFKSAKRSEEFRDRKSVFDLLWRLATCYRSNLLAGKGDVEARQAFTTTEFAPHDGEIGERDRKQRCFEYRGERREFQKHLRIGFKESASETLRIYFDFDTSEKKIVIAYCGPHLKY